jgi:hypothetical protein
LRAGSGNDHFWRALSVKDTVRETVSRSLIFAPSFFAEKLSKSPNLT